MSNKNRWSQHYNNIIAGVTLGLTLTACSLDSLVRVDDSSIGGEIDHSRIETYSGAVGVYNYAVSSFSLAINDVSQTGGLFTDELSVAAGSNSNDRRFSTSARGLDGAFLFTRIQSSRINATQARQLLRKYGSQKDSSSIGNTYAMEGFSILLLAEFFCSGVPLSELGYNSPLVYTRGFTTAEMMEKAVAKFDSALLVAADSLPVATLARIGKGRALLGIAKYTEAAEAVRGLTFEAPYVVRYLSTVFSPWFATANTASAYRVLNNEGGGLINWSGATPADEDPRVPITRLAGNTGAYSIPMRQAKYEVGAGVSSIIVAQGVEALLIEAEALMQPAEAPVGDWLGKINEARRTRSDLPDLSDPGSAEARVNLLFRERAMWNYLTGSRLGDMRRLVRNYHRGSIEVFPSGTYPGPGAVVLYGSEVVYVLPIAEEEQNPLYNGCENREA